MVLCRVLYPTGSMQQLLNGRAALSNLYARGPGICSCALGGRKGVLGVHLLLAIMSNPQYSQSFFFNKENGRDFDTFSMLNNGNNN